MTEHLGDLLLRVADEAPAPARDLVAAGMRRGSRLRRRRRAVRLGGAAALVSVAAGVGTWAVTGDDPTRARHEPAPVATATPDTPTTPGADLGLRQAARAALAPAGTLSAVSVRTDAGFAELTATLTDGSGESAGVTVVLASSALVGFPSSSALTATPPSACTDVSDAGLHRFRCAEVDDLLAVDYRVRTDDSDPEDGAYADVAEVLHPDGLVSRVDAHNAAGFGAEQTLDRPLLDVPQLREVAADPVWLRVDLTR